MKTKKMIALLAAVSVAASAMPATVYAEDMQIKDILTWESFTAETELPQEELPLFGDNLTEGDYSYYVDTDGYAVLAAYSGSARSVSIPTKLGGYTVKTIGAGAFRDNDNLVNVTIGSNIVNIGSDAFRGCVNLSEIVIPNSVKTLGSCAFDNCISLKKAVIGSGITKIEGGTFYGCAKLTSVTFSSNITEIGGKAFSNSGISGVVNLPEPITFIDDYAFSGCSNITAVNFGSKIKTMGREVFRNCDGILSVTLPDSLTEWGSGLFTECDSLKKVTFGSGSKNTGWATFARCTSLTDIVFSPVIDTIGRECFLGCTALKKVVIPDTVTTLGSECFRNCSSLRYLTIGKNLVNYDGAAFENCISLTDVVIPDTIPNMNGSAVFRGCKGLQTALLGKNLAKVCDNIFAGCDSLTDVVIKEGVLRLDRSAFIDCFGLKRIYIPSTLNTIEEGAFDYLNDTKFSIFYGGSKSNWNYITKYSFIDSNLENAAIYYDCPEPVNITSLKMANGAPTLTWTASSGAGAYRVYRSEKLNGTLKYLGSVRTRTFTDTTAVVGKTYYYHVVAYKDSDSFSSSIPKRITVTNAVTAPAAPKFTVTAGTNSAVIRWNAVSGATGYRVFYRVSGTSKWAYKTTTRAAMNLTGLTGGKKYDILVRAYNGNTKLWSKFTSANILTVTPKKAVAKPTVTSVTGGVNKAVIRWNAVSGAKYYRVYYRIKGTSAWSFKSTTLTAMNLTGLTGGKTYEIVVRATDGSVWSAMTTADIKTVIVKTA